MRLSHLALLILWCLPVQVLAQAQTQVMPRSVSADRAENRGAARATEARPRRASAAALASARAFLCPHGGTPQGRGRCTRGTGLGSLGTGWQGDDPAVRDWHQGLAPPRGTQAPCPPGTTAMPARDQPSVTRCVAG